MSYGYVYVLCPAPALDSLACFFRVSSVFERFQPQSGECLVGRVHQRGTGQFPPLQPTPHPPANLASLLPLLISISLNPPPQEQERGLCWRPTDLRPRDWGGPREGCGEARAPIRDT
jgi:hypothetical protein